MSKKNQMSWAEKWNKTILVILPRRVIYTHGAQRMTIPYKDVDEIPKILSKLPTKPLDMFVNKTRALGKRVMLKLVIREPEGSIDDK